MQEQPVWNFNGLFRTVFSHSLMLLKLVCSINDPQTCERVLGIVSTLDVFHHFIEPGEMILERTLGESADVYLIDRSTVSDIQSVGLFQELPDQPEVILLVDEEEAEDQAKLIGLGADAFIDLKLDDNLIKESLKARLCKREFFESERITKGDVQEPKLADFVSQSNSMKNMLSVTERIVSSDVTVLVLGETGVGKERLARALHNDGPRCQGPFVAINCGGLPENLLESELFGHEKGSFTGAVRERKGCFEMAHRGTIFLDEIGDMPLHLQVKLLRVLQERRIKRLGGEQELEVDVRILAATNHDVEALVQAGEFRRDLFYRLSVISLTLPSLRERSGDIPELVKNYIRIFRYRLNRAVYNVTPDAMEALLSYPWPGNIRELVNVMERAVLLCVGETINLDDLALPGSHIVSRIVEAPEEVASENIVPKLPADWKNISYHELKNRILSEFEARYFTDLLERSGGRVGVAAKNAGIQERSLFEKMRKLGLRKEDFKK